MQPTRLDIMRSCVVRGVAGGVEEGEPRPPVPLTFFPLPLAMQMVTCRRGDAGHVLAANYLRVPAMPSQSLQLTGERLSGL